MEVLGTEEVGAEEVGLVTAREVVADDGGRVRALEAPRAVQDEVAGLPGIQGAGELGMVELVPDLPGVDEALEVVAQPLGRRLEMPEEVLGPELPVPAGVAVGEGWGRA
jgi:hypothetical protein